MAEVNKISSFKSFSEIKAQENEMKLREENTLKKQETLVKIEEILDEMGLTSLSEIDEDSQKTFISKLLGREMNEGNAFVYAAAKAKQEGKDEFEFNGKTYKVTIKDTGVKEGNAFGDAVRKAKEAGESEFEFDGETYKVEEHLDEAISRSAFDRMDGLHNIKAMDALINAADTIFADLTEEMFEFDEIADFITMKLKKSKLAKTYESYDIANEALSLEQKKVERFLNSLAKEFDYPVLDAARFVISTIKKMGLYESTMNEEIDIYDSLGKLMDELQVQISNLKTSTKDAAWLKQLDLIESAFEKLEDRISIASKKLGVIPESTVNEARISASKILQEIIDGNTTRAEGIKISKELASHFLTWIESSPFGKKNAGLPLHMLIKASFNWGIERGLDPKLKGELDALKNSVKESVVNEAEIKSDDEFKEYAMTVLKKRLAMSLMNPKQKK